MKIGLAFDLKPDTPPPKGRPDDWHEEFDARGTIDSIALVLQNLGHQVTLLGNGPELLQKLLADPPEAVFCFAEGHGVSRNRESRVPAVCEMLGISYTGSDPFALAAALDKDITRRLASEAGVRIPNGVTLPCPAEPYDGEYAEFPAILEEAGLKLPVLVKPAYEGSSKGIRTRCLVNDAEQLGEVVVSLWNDYGQAVLIEEFIEGIEVTVGLIGNRPPQTFGMMTITPKEPVGQFVYSLEVKREFRRLIDYHCPAPLPVKVIEEIELAAHTMFDALGCQDVARLDFRLRDDLPYFLEINPLPGLNPDSSDLVIMAGLLGVSHAELIEQIMQAATSRWAASKPA